MAMVGRGGDAIETERVLDYRKVENRQMCRLYLSMMEKMNVQPGRFGDATKPLREV
jgi:hypothetical protein